MRPDALPAVTVPPSLKTGRQRGQRLERGLAGMLVGVEDERPPFLCGISTGTISSLNRPDSMAAKALSWLCRAKRILLLPGDAVLLGQVLGGETHGQVAVDLDGLRARLALGVGVDQHGVAGAVPVTGAPQVVRSVAHALDPARHHDVGQAAS